MASELFCYEQAVKSLPADYRYALKFIQETDSGGSAFDLDPDALDAVDAAASWDSWNRLRRAQGCSVARARRILTRTISSLIEGAA